MALRVDERLLDRRRELLRHGGIRLRPLGQRCITSDRPELAQDGPGGHHDARAVEIQRLRQERLRHPDRVDLTVAQCRAHRRKRHRQQMDRARVDADLPQRRFDHHLTDALQRVHRDGLAGEIRRLTDRAVAFDEDVLPVVGGGRPLHLARRNCADGDPLRTGDHHRHPAQVADLAVVVREREDDVVPALQRLLVDVDALSGEEAFLDPEVHRQRVRDRKRVDGDGDEAAALRTRDDAPEQRQHGEQRSSDNGEAAHRSPLPFRLRRAGAIIASRCPNV